jgi:hypothetical protein
LQEKTAAVDLLGLALGVLEGPNGFHNKSVLGTEEGLDGDAGNGELGPALGKKEPRAIQECMVEMR